MAKYCPICFRGSVPVMKVREWFINNLNKWVTRIEISTELGFSKETASRALNRLAMADFIEAEGTTVNRRFRRVEEDPPTLL